jgi:hypothetical protein
MSNQDGSEPQTGKASKDVAKSETVDRFTWERLLMMSGWWDEDHRFRVHAAGIFMSADGSNCRPGNKGLACFGMHEKTWAATLRRTVRDGWLQVIERGGSHRGPGGTRINRATVYRASVPLDVWERRDEILNAPPYKAAPFTPEDAPVKGAPEDSLDTAEQEAPAVMKGAVEGSLHSVPPELQALVKGAVEDSLHRLLATYEGSARSYEGSPQGLPHQVVTSRSSKDLSAAPGSERDDNEASAFVAFWNLYPKQTDETGARKEWQAAVQAGADPQEIITGAKAYAEEWSGATGAELHWAVKSSGWLAAGMWNGTWPPRHPDRGKPQSQSGARSDIASAENVNNATMKDVFG